MSKLLDIQNRIRHKKKVEKNYTPKLKERFEVRDSRGKEFFIVDNAFIDKYIRAIGINASCVYFALCRHADKNQLCFPSIELLSDYFKISRSSVIRAIKILEWHNIIKVDKIKGQVNIYTLINKKYWRLKKVVGTAAVCKGPVKMNLRVVDE